MRGAELIATCPVVLYTGSLVPREVLVMGVLWLVGQFSPSTATSLFLGALMMWQ